MQATFIILAYNLSQLLHAQTSQDQMEDDPKNPQQDRAADKKRKKRQKELKGKVESRGGQLPLLRAVPQKASQLSVKFYRWLAQHLYDASPWRVALGRLQQVYSHY